MRIAAFVVVSSCVCALAFGAEQVGFEPPAERASLDEFADRLLAADLDADGHADLVSYSRSYARLTVLRGRGDGTFAAGVVHDLPLWTQAIAVGDLNGDDQLDIVTAHFERSLHVLLSDGSGDYAGTEYTGLGRQPRVVLLLDVNGDGDLDVVLDTDDGAEAMDNDGNGVLSASRPLGDGSDPYAKPKALADLDGDGDTDIVAFAPLYAEDDGTFAIGNRLPALGADPVPVDVDGDGDVDIVSVGTSQFPRPGELGRTFTLFNDGSGDFAWVEGRTTVEAPGDLKVADLNGDGFPELISAGARGKVGVLINAGDGTYEHLNTFEHDPAGGLAGIAAADFDEDGRMDLATGGWRFDGSTWHSNIKIHRGIAVTAPTVTDFEPRSAPLESTVDVTFTGTGFVPGATLEYEGIDVMVEEVRVDSPTRLTATVTIGGIGFGKGIGTREIQVRNPDGGSAPFTFDVTDGPVPDVSAVSPAIAEAGETVLLEVTGQGFADDATVGFGPHATVNTVTHHGRERIAVNVTLGPDPGRLDLVVTNPANGFTTTVRDAVTVLQRQTLDVVPQRGKLIDRARRGRDRLDVSGTLDFTLRSPDGAFESRTDDVRLLVGDPSDPFVVNVPAGDRGWRVRGGRHVWKSPRRERPRVRLEIDTGRLTFRVAVSRAELDVPAEGSILFDLIAGDDAGRDTRAWEPFRRGLRLR